jgi:hypothetical protein
MRAISLLLVAVSALLAGAWRQGVRPRVLQQVAGVCAGLAVLCPEIQQAGAAVGEGDLPPGAVAFQKVIKYQKDWRVLTESIKPRVAEVEGKEVTAIKVILKQLANEYYDLELLSKSITDPDKAAAALALAKDFRVQMRANDDAATAGNIQKIVDSYPSTAKDLSDFLDLLSDVPDEI